MEESPKQSQYLFSALVSKGEDLLELQKQFEAFGLKIDRAEDLGQRDLAFPVKKHRQLHLVSLTFQATKVKIQALREEIRHSPIILRSLLTLWREPLNKPKKERKSGVEKIVIEEGKDV